MADGDRFQGGWRIHAERERRLMAEIERRAVIPVRGFQQTAAGMMPPPQVSGGGGYTPRWQESLTSFNTGTPELPVYEPRFSWANGGVVYAPSYDGTPPEQLAHREHAAFVPLMAGVPILWRNTTTNPDPPFLVPTLDTVNVVYLEVTWTEKDTKVGKTLFEDIAGDWIIRAKWPSARNHVDGVTELAEALHKHEVNGATDSNDPPPEAHTHNFTTETGGPLDITTGAPGPEHQHIIFQAGLTPGADIGIPISERNYFISAAANLEVKIDTESNYNSPNRDESELVEKVPLLKFLCTAGAPAEPHSFSDVRNYVLGGALPLSRASHIIDGNDGEDDGNDGPLPQGADYNNNHQSASYGLPPV